MGTYESIRDEQIETVEALRREKSEGARRRLLIKEGDALFVRLCELRKEGAELPQELAAQIKSLAERLGIKVRKPVVEVSQAFGLFSKIRQAQRK